MKKVVARTPDNNTVDQNVPKEGYRNRLKLLESYGSPIPDYIIEEIADDLENWVLHTEALRIKDFKWERRIPVSTYDDMLKRNKRLQEAHQLALDVIASRRERGAIKKYYDANAAYKMMSLYDPDYTRVLKEEAEIKKISQGEQAGANTFNVYLEPIPNSPMVPVLKGDDE